MADIIIYGGGFTAVAAAAKAANNSPNKSVLVVAPYPTAKLGGIATYVNILKIEASEFTRLNLHFDMRQH